MSGKHAFLLLLIVGLVGLAYGVSIRLSAETVNILVGLMCGVAASVPVSLGLLIALTRQREPSSDEVSAGPPSYMDLPGYEPRPPQSPYPPVIFVAPPQNSMPNPYLNLLPPGSLPPGYSLNEPPHTRDFKIIGEDDDTLE